MTHSGELPAPLPYPRLPSSDHSAEKHLLGSPQGGLGPPTVFRKREKTVRKKKNAFQFHEGKSTLQRPTISTVLGFTWGWGGEEERGRKKTHLAGPDRGEILLIIKHFQQQSIQCFENNVLVPALKARPSGRL